MTKAVDNRSHFDYNVNTQFTERIFTGYIQEDTLMSEETNISVAEEIPKQEEAQNTEQTKREDKKPEGKKRKRRFGDRREGRRIRTLDGFHVAMPFIMKDRSDACNTFADEVDISKADVFVREQIQSGKENFSILHVILAGYVRTVAAYPFINRFISGQRIYARNNIEVAMTVKKEMTMDAPETCIKVIFDPHDTVFDIYEKFNAVVTNIDQTDTDGVASFFKKFPRLPFRWTVSLIKCLDYWGLCPKMLMDALPFWGSMIITSMGSLGIKPIYHHLYNFGNLPIFVSYGTKRKVVNVNKRGEISTTRVIDMKIVTDERTCDGFQYAAAFKLWKRLIENPEVLKNPPEEVNEDID